MSSALIRYDAMCHAIAAAYEVDEVKDIRDKAMALEVYARQAHNTEAERQACEIRLRAERKVGQLLREREMAKGTRLAPGGNTVRPPEDELTLDDLHISKSQSSRWQQLAALPEDAFETSLAAPDPSTNGILAAHRQPTQNPVDLRALWLWGRLQDFEREGLLAEDPATILGTMLTHMKTTTLAMAPRVAAWLEGIKP